MKNIIFVVMLCMLISIGNLWAQDYLSYYKLCNEADEQIYLKDYAAALEKFELAFKSVPYVHIKEYIQASKCAALLRKHEVTFRYISASKKQGGSDEFLSKKMFKQFKKTDYYQKYLDNMPTYEAIYEASINHEYAKSLDSLMYVDQYLVRNNKSYGNKDYEGNYVVADERPENMWDLDKLVFERLLVLIDQYGFPSEELVGAQANNNARLLLLHHLRLEENLKYHPMALNAIEKGYYLPSDFATMYSLYCNHTGAKHPYLTWDGDLSEDNIAYLDKHRAAIGLPPLRAFTIKGGGLKVGYKWGRF